MALTILGALSLSSSLNLSTVGNALVVPIAPTKRLALSINGLTGSGATLAIDGSRDGGNTWATTGMTVVDYDTGAAVAALIDDADYRVITRGYTHLQIRVATAGTGSALLLLVSQARGQDVFLANPSAGGGGGGGTGGVVSDPPVEAALGTPTDTPWTTGAATLVGLGKRMVGQLATKLSVVVTDMLPTGTNKIGDVGTPDLLAVERPYQGVVGMTVGTAQPAQRAVRINCTTAGNVGLTYADGSTDVIPVNVGLSVWAGAITTINSAGTTAAATYANLK